MLWSASHHSHLSPQANERYVARAGDGIRAGDAIKHGMGELVSEKDASRYKVGVLCGGMLCTWCTNTGHSPNRPAHLLQPSITHPPQAKKPANEGYIEPEVQDYLDIVAPTQLPEGETEMTLPAKVCVF